MLMDSKAYTSWKSWSAERFGFCARTQRVYFKSEMHRTNLDFTKDIRALEIGFGNGSFLSYARSQGWSVDGLEMIEALVEQAKEHGFSAYHSSKIASLISSSYDLVVAFDVFEHLIEQDLDALLSDIWCLLCVGGCLVARFPNGDSPFGLEGQNGDPTHVTAIGVSKMCYYAKKYGFDVIYLGGEACPLPAGNVGRTLRTLLTLPIMWIVDFLVKNIFLPGSGISFSSRNTAVVLRKAMPTGCS